MADVNRGGRPLSPHLSIYRPEMNMLMSISHRITGVGLTVGAVLIVWWLLAAATSEEHFAFINGLLTSWVGAAVLILSSGALWYKAASGVRHLLWDTGWGFEPPTIAKTSPIVLVVAAALWILNVIVAI